MIGSICAHENRPCNRYRTFTIANACNFTVWPATRSNIPVAGGGFKLAAGTSVDVSVPDGWIGNWSPRTGCLFDAQGRGACEVGDCGGLLACDGDADIMPSDHTVVSVAAPTCRRRTGWPGVQWRARLGAMRRLRQRRAPDAQAEFNMDSWGGVDFYDIIAAYYNLAVLIQPSDPACAAAGCRSDLNARCERTPADGRLLSPAGMQACHRLPLVLNARADPGASS